MPRQMISLGEKGRDDTTKMPAVPPWLLYRVPVVEGGLLAWRVREPTANGHPLGTKQLFMWELMLCSTTTTTPVAHTVALVWMNLFF